MEYQNQIEYKVYGRYALQCITVSIFWNPTFIWVFDSVRILNMIQKESKGMRPIKYSGGNDLASYTYLKDVEYHVKAHFEWNENRPELQADRNEDKHYQIANRMFNRSGRIDIFLATRE